MVASSAVVSKADDYSSYLTASTDDINIRSNCSTDSDIVGELSYGDYAMILDEESDWYHIQSGEVDGWVSKQYSITGYEAYIAIEYCKDLTATVKTDNLRVRTKPSEDSSTVALANIGDSYEVLDEYVVTEGFVAIYYGEQTRYVAAEYVDVEISYSFAKTMDDMIAESEYKSNVKYLASIIYCEARGESYEGKVAVGAVVLNRVDDSTYPDTVYEVITDSGQFEPVGTGWFYSVLEAESYDEECLQAAKDALSGADPTAGCVYFCRVESGYRGMIIGNHVFYIDWDVSTGVG